MFGKFTLVLALSAAGCSTTVTMPELSHGHPAHPMAAPAPSPVPTIDVSRGTAGVAHPALPVPRHDGGDSTNTTWDLHIVHESKLTHEHQGPASTSRTHPGPTPRPQAGDPGVVVRCPVHPGVHGAPNDQCRVCGLPLLPERMSPMETMDAMEKSGTEDRTHGGTHQSHGDGAMP